MLVESAEERTSGAKVPARLSKRADELVKLGAVYQKATDRISFISNLHRLVIALLKQGGTFEGNLFIKYKTR